MLRVWIIPAAVLIAVAAAIWLGANYALETVTRAALASLIERTREGGVALRTVHFAGASIHSPFWVQWHGVHAGVERERPGEAEPELFELSADIVDLQLLGSAKAGVEATGVTLARPVATPEGDVDEVLLEGDRFRIEFPVNPFDPTPGLAAAGREVVRLVESGSARAAIEFEGSALLRLRGEEARLGLTTRQGEEGATLIASAEDLQSISALYDERLNQAEIELISERVHRAPRLLQLREKAESRAREEHRRHPGVSEDAYRHVIWSYMLTREFGAEFAKTVTDAHERGSTGNTPAERDMDYRNNALGRSYAERGLPEEAVFDTVREDPEAVRAPGE